MQVVIFLLVLCAVVVADIQFTRPQRSEYYCMVGVAALMYAALKAFFTLCLLTDEKQPLRGVIIGLAMAGIPLLVWGVPAIVRFPWMGEILRSDGEGD